MIPVRQIHVAGVTPILDILGDASQFLDRVISIQGHVQELRESKTMIFTTVFDSWKTHSCPFPIVLEKKHFSETELKKIQRGSFLHVKGQIQATPKRRDPYELCATAIIFISEMYDYGSCIFASESAKMSLIASDVGTQCFDPIRSTIFGLKGEIERSVAEFFDRSGVAKVTTPTITFAECESGCKPLGVTQLFRDEFKPIFSTQERPIIDYSKDLSQYDFFGQPAFLTVSSQLDLRTFLPMGGVWVMTRAFRGEFSSTRRHLAEFDMVEGEFSSSKSEDIMQIAEDCIVYSIKTMLIKYRKYLEFLTSSHERYGIDKDRIRKLESYISKPFIRIEHYDAITLLRESHAKTPFKIEPLYEEDLSSEHEKWLCDHFSHPVIVMHYPEDVKAFYMPRLARGKVHGVHHVDSFDILIDGIEIVGGSQRIHVYEELVEKIGSRGMALKPLQQFADLCRRGTHPHGGFGIGFERLVMLILGTQTIHDVTAFPRFYDGMSMKQLMFTTS